VRPQRTAARADHPWERHALGFRRRRAERDGRELAGAKKRRARVSPSTPGRRGQRRSRSPPPRPAVKMDPGGRQDDAKPKEEVTKRATLGSLFPLSWCARA
jgi:hypothetical protein